MDPNDYVFRKRTGVTLVKAPGSIDGNGFVLDTLHDCDVYLLDHTSQVQIDDCVNCRIFVGPTDGSVFLRDCRDCTLCVAARQLRTRDCKDLDIALYCATQPSIETSTGIVFSCWRGAYPGLSDHFRKARLDPTKNTWRQVYDFNRTEDLGVPHFRLDESVRPWWTAPLLPSGEAAGEAAAAMPDCPVPAADGSLYGGGYLPQEQSSPKSSPVPTVRLPDKLPPSPGRAAGYDEEVELDDDEEPVVVLPPGLEDGGRSFVAPAQPSPRAEEPPQRSHQQHQPAVPNAAVCPAFTFDSPRTSATAVGDGGARVSGAISAGGESSGGISGDGSGNPFGDGFWGAAESPQVAVSLAVETAPPPPQIELPPPPPLHLPAGPGTDAAAASGLHANGVVADAFPNVDSSAAPLPTPPPGTDLLGGSVLSMLQQAPAVGPNGDARLAWRVANARKLAQVAAQEVKDRAALREEASRRLEAMQQTRAARLKQRFATNRAHDKSNVAAAATAAGAGVSPGGDSGAAGVWERVAELVDLKGSGGGGPAAAPSRDVARMRQLIVGLKGSRGR